MTNRTDKDKEFYKRIDEVAHYIWDPIGVSDVPEARDEYYSYLPQLAARSKSGDVRHLLDYMQNIATKTMGLNYNEEQAKLAAETMIAWAECIYE